jgi:radical SAM/Cys-rich protein
LNGFMQCVVESGHPIIKASNVDIIQVNLGFLCNQQCAHCHLDASPDRPEIMNWETMLAVLSAAEHLHCNLIDITGGAPEMNPNFKKFVTAASKAGFDAQVRTNLSVLTEPEQTDLPQFFKTNRIRLVGSMPCYLEENVRAQRGPAVYEKSIEAIRKLNAIGYGVDPTLQLNLVYNPGGDFLPGSQEELEADYKRRLFEDHGLVFSRLFTITNAPIGRFRQYLEANGELEKYLELLADSFNPDVAGDIMCRGLVSIDYRGIAYNCDFNQAMNMPIVDSCGNVVTIDTLEEALAGSIDIITDSHCFCCTAGVGSSCTGALLK